MKSLRAHLFWTIALAVLASVSATLLLSAYLLERSLSRGAVASLGRQADLLAEGALRTGTPKLGLFLATQEERLTVLPRRQAALLLPEGARLPAQGTVTVRGTRYLYAARASGADTIVLLRPAKLAAADRRPLFLALVAAGGLGAALAALLAALLARGIAGPVRRAADASRALAEGGMPPPLRVSGSDELRTLARTFNETAEKLSRAREAERAFLLSVSHELKTPLTAIRGYAEALEEGVLAPHEAVTVIHAEAAHLERLVADLLELARLNRLEFATRREPVDLAEVAREAAARHAAHAREAGVMLVAETDGSAPAEADRDRVVQVVSNLVENALRCTPAGGRVTVSAARGLIEVADTGTGIAAPDLPRAFDRFFLHRRYAGERPVGTGLGLAIVKQLTEAMGGTVAVESGPGRGTRFAVRLPIDQKAAAAGSSPSTPHSQTSRKAPAASGSNCDPAQRSTSSSASSVVKAVR